MSLVGRRRNRIISVSVLFLTVVGLMFWQILDDYSPPAFKEELINTEVINIDKRGVMQDPQSQAVINEIEIITTNYNLQGQISGDQIHLDKNGGDATAGLEQKEAMDGNIATIDRDRAKINAYAGNINNAPNSIPSPTTTSALNKGVKGNLTSRRTFKCVQNSTCVRRYASEGEASVTPEVCWLSCNPLGALWPLPTKEVFVGRGCLVAFQLGELQLRNTYANVIDKMWNIFLEKLSMMKTNAPKYFPEEKIATTDSPFDNTGSKRVMVEISVANLSSTLIRLDLDESYNLKVIKDDESCVNRSIPVKVKIEARTIFGARHALETLLQLVTYDTVKNLFQMVSQADVWDEPMYPYRGVMIDSARNFLPVPAIKDIIDTMSQNKLNVLHWHLTDSNSFSFYSTQVPQMTEFGAYGRDKIYYPEDVKGLIEYATLRGVKIIPELDAPSHAGFGWEWGEFEGLGKLAVCVNAQPYRYYCGQPPCGQLNPINSNTYEVLGKIYEDMLALFDSDVFHMGGDEVYPQCWTQFLNSTVRGPTPQLELWSSFQKKALAKLRNASQNRLWKAMVWTSGLTEAENRTEYLSPNDYIIHVWSGSGTKASLETVHVLVRDGYQLVISNGNKMYLDHGGEMWLGQDQNYDWIRWQEIYDNKLSIFLPDKDQDWNKSRSERNILGGEIPLWSERVNEDNVFVKLWPRGAAAAENFWSNPFLRSNFVFTRLNHHIRRMRQLGAKVDQLQPESCYLLSGHCYDPELASRYQP